MKNVFGDFDIGLQKRAGHLEGEVKPRFWTVFAAGIFAGSVASSSVTPVCFFLT